MIYSPHSSYKKQGGVILLTGLSGAGKSTLAFALQREFVTRHKISTLILDGDQLHSGLNSDLGMSREHQLENLRRIGHLAKLIQDQSQLVICAHIAPYRTARQFIRSRNEPSYVEVYLSCPATVLVQRDVKGYYAKASQGEMSLNEVSNNVGSEYEPPEKPNLVIETDVLSVDDSVREITHLIRDILQISC